MTDVPVIFSGPMVLALLGGRKTMTRRLAWRAWNKDEAARPPGQQRQRQTPWCKTEPGDRLWVRENFWQWGQWRGTKSGGGKVSYSFQPLREPADLPGLIHAADWTEAPALGAADRGKFGQDEPAWHLRPNIFLRREESRITLVVTEVKVERLQDISDADAIAEGIVEDDGSEPDIFYLPGARTISGVNAPKGRSLIGQHSSPRLVFRDLINNLHGDELWSSNPEVVALRFTVHEQNIDSIQEAA